MGYQAHFLLFHTGKCLVLELLHIRSIILQPLHNSHGYDRGQDLYGMDQSLYILMRHDWLASYNGQQSRQLVGQRGQVCLLQYLDISLSLSEQSHYDRHLQQQLQQQVHHRQLSQSRQDPGYTLILVGLLLRYQCRFQLSSQIQGLLLWRMYRVLWTLWLWGGALALATTLRTGQYIRYSHRGYRGKFEVVDHLLY